MTVDSTTAPTLSRQAASGMLWSQGARVVEVVIAFGTGVLVARGLNPLGLGTYSLLTNLAGAASVFIPVVTTESLGAVFPRLKTRNERVFLTLVIGTLRAGVVIVVTLVMLAVWSKFAPTVGLGGVPRSLAWLAAAYWIAQDLLNTVTGYYGAELDMRPVAMWRTAGLSATFATVLVFAATNSFTEGRVLAAVSSGYGLAFAGLALSLRRVGRPHSPSRQELRHAFGLTKNIWLIGVLSFTLATQIDILLIGALTNDRRQAAFYATAVGVIWRLQLLLVAGWAALIIPLFGHSFTSGGIPRLRRAWRRSSQLWLLISLPLNALLLANAFDVIGLLFGSPYLPATRLLEVVCSFNLATAFLVGGTCVGALYAADRQKILARFRFFSAGLNVVLALVLIPPYGALGAAIATGVSALVGGVIEFDLSRRLGVNDYPLRLAFIAAIAAGVATIPGFVIHPTDAPQLLLSGGLGIVLFVGVLAAWKPLDADDVAAAAALHPKLGTVARRMFAHAG